MLNLTNNMSEGKRPYGLTALAVLNFVFVGFVAVGAQALWARYSLVPSTPDVTITAYSLTQQDGPMILMAAILMLVSMTLLIVSGIGYIGQKKILGQRVGSIYGMIGIAGTVLVILVAKTGFGIETIIGLTYPILTLVLLNTTFKEDFVNP
jgi:hypothetical protein